MLFGGRSPLHCRKKEDSLQFSIYSFFATIEDKQNVLVKHVSANYRKIAIWR